jgi:nickel transport protein
MTKILATLFLAVALAAGVSLSASAHKLVAGAYAAGDHVEGEIGFSDGTMAKNALVEVLTEDGKKLGETRTGDDGTFTFTPTQRVVHVFHADLGGGHVANVRLEIGELPIGLAAPDGKAEADSGKGKPPASANTAADPRSTDAAVLTAAQRGVVAEAVRNEMRPLRREIIAMKEKNDLQSILGGMGYIVGLFGLWFFLAARRQKASG